MSDNQNIKQLFTTYIKNNVNPLTIVATAINLIFFSLLVTIANNPPNIDTSINKNINTSRFIA